MNDLFSTLMRFFKFSLSFFIGLGFYFNACLQYKDSKYARSKYYEGVYRFRLKTRSTDIIDATNDSDTINSLKNWAVYLRKIGLYEDALPKFEEVYRYEKNHRIIYSFSP